MDPDLSQTLPALACDTHSHVYGNETRYPLREGQHAVVDATHPFAATITGNAAAATAGNRSADIRRIRIMRSRYDAGVPRGCACAGHDSAGQFGPVVRELPEGIAEFAPLVEYECGLERGNQ